MADTADELDKIRHAETAMRDGGGTCLPVPGAGTAQTRAARRSENRAVALWLCRNWRLPFSIYLTQWWSKLEEMKVVLILIVLVAGILATVGLSCSIIARKRKARASASEKQDKK